MVDESFVIGRSSGPSADDEEMKRPRNPAREVKGKESLVRKRINCNKKHNLNGSSDNPRLLVPTNSKTLATTLQSSLTNQTGN